MGTKNNPGQFDCYANAEPDEPMFVLLGRDRHAARLVRIWALLRARDGEDPAKVAEALNCAQQMDEWFSDNKGLVGPDSDVTMRLYHAVTEGLDGHPEEFEHACSCDVCKSYE